jgi:hypothetical protein
MLYVRVKHGKIWKNVIFHPSNKAGKFWKIQTVDGHCGVVMGMDDSPASLGKLLKGKR